MTARQPRTVHPQLDKSGVHVYERFLSAYFEEDFFVFQEDILCFAQYGASTLEVGEAELTLSEGEIVYLPGGTAHRWRNPEDRTAVQLFLCYLPERLSVFGPARDALTMFTGTFPVACPYDPAESHRKARLLTTIRSMRVEQRSRRGASPALLWAYLIELLVLLERTYSEHLLRGRLSSRDRAFAASLAYLHEHAHEPLTVRDLAEIAGVSYRTYTAWFKDQTGTTVNDYLSRLRIDAAKRRLIESGDILHASLEAGFQNLAHFYRVFRKHTGQTPRAYMREHRIL